MTILILSYTQLNIQIRNKKKKMSAWCAPACVLPLQHTSNACKLRGVTSLTVPAICPLVLAELYDLESAYKHCNLWRGFPTHQDGFQKGDEGQLNHLLGDVLVAGVFVPYLSFLISVEVVC